MVSDRDTPADPSPARAAIPNALTLARIALAVLCFAALCLAEPASRPDSPGPSFRGSPWLIAALTLFIAAAATDALDGHLARRWNVVSRFGRVMDPFADKLLILGTLLLLAHPRFWAGMHVPLGTIELAGIQGWMVVAIMARELLVTSLRAVYETEGVDFSATASGKVKMVLQSICAPAAMLVLVTHDDPVPRGIAGALAALIWATVVFSLVSGAPYAWRALRAERISPGTPPGPPPGTPPGPTPSTERR